MPPLATSAPSRSVTLSERLWHPLGREELQFATALDLPECQERLEDTLASRRPATRLFAGGAPPSAAPVGAVENGRFYVEPPYRNTFKTIAAGQLLPEPDGTRVTVSLSMGWWATLAMLVATLPGLFLALRGLWVGQPGALAVIPLWLAIIAAAVAFGRWRARQDRAYLLTYLEDTLELSAQEREPTGH